MGRVNGYYSVKGQCNFSTEAEGVEPVTKIRQSVSSETVVISEVFYFGERIYQLFITQLCFDLC